ncbi:MAG: response regulator [Planctomycetota bacterium]
MNDSSTDTAAVHPSRRPARVLVVDRDTRVPALLRDCRPDGQTLDIIQAGSLAVARDLVDSQRIDLAIIDPALPDGDGYELAAELADAPSPSKPAVATLIAGASADFDAARKALAAGAADFLVKPELTTNELTDRLAHTLAKQRKDAKLARRVRRLKKLCKRLNDARLEVAGQVDTLCNDLVTAYQELAVQMKGVVDDTRTVEDVLSEELDLEQVIRKTLEWLVGQSGPSNAAVFLPCSMDEFSLGGYVNHDCTAESADMLLQHLADVLAPKVADTSTSDELIHLRDNAAIERWIGDDAAYLADAEVIAFAARTDDESLAVLCLFRDAETPFPDEVVNACRALAPILGETLARLIRIHHRHLPDPALFDTEPSEPDTDDWGTAEWSGDDDNPFDEDDDGGLPL